MGVVVSFSPELYKEPDRDTGSPYPAPYRGIGPEHFYRDLVLRERRRVFPLNSCHSTLNVRCQARTTRTDRSLLRLSVLKCTIHTIKPCPPLRRQFFLSSLDFVDRRHSVVQAKFDVIAHGSISYLTVTAMMLLIVVIGIAFLHALCYLFAPRRQSTCHHFSSSVLAESLRNLNRQPPFHRWSSISSLTAAVPPHLLERSAEPAAFFCTTAHPCNVTAAPSTGSSRRLIHFFPILYLLFVFVVICIAGFILRCVFDIFPFVCFVSFRSIPVMMLPSCTQLSRLSFLSSAIFAQHKTLPCGSNQLRSSG